MSRYTAISVVFPAGQKIRSGEKTLEIRRWRPDTLPLRNLLIVQNEAFLNSKDRPEDPNGQAVALVDVENIRRWKKSDLEAACGTYWEDGWLAWELSNVRPIYKTDTVTAKLRLYEVEFITSEHQSS